ncbi:MAG: hypothetical protein FWG36_09095 [Oscillospiraceae bacterium]|nr:hypothetical protein [Oscillospiraceae bacterium]
MTLKIWQRIALILKIFRYICYCIIFALTARYVYHSWIRARAARDFVIPALSWCFSLIPRIFFGHDTSHYEENLSNVFNILFIIITVLILRKIYKLLSKLFYYFFTLRIQEIWNYSSNDTVKKIRIDNQRAYGLVATVKTSRAAEEYWSDIIIRSRVRKALFAHSIFRAVDCSNCVKIHFTPIFLHKFQRRDVLKKSGVSKANSVKIAAALPSPPPTADQGEG